jgi:predicted nucleic acid-binding protein
MSAVDFLDTNILVYSYDTVDLRKQGVAQNLVDQALDGDFIISGQVLAEFASTLLHKLAPSISPVAVTRILDALGPIRTIATDTGMVRRAVEAAGAYGLHFYDGLIIAAAERGGSETIWSEDFNADQRYFGITVRNPF